MLIKMITSMEELKPFYVLTGKFAQNASICSMIMEDATNHETWIEVFRLPIERWIKETQPFLELSVNMEPEYPEMSDLSGSTEVIRSNEAMWDRLQLTQPTLMCRIRMPNSLTATQTKSLSNVLRQVADKTTTLFPTNTFAVGTHLFSDSSLEWRRNEFISSRGYPECLVRPPEPEAHEQEAPTITEAQKVIRSLSTVTLPQVDNIEAVTRKDSSIAKSPANKSNQRDGVSPKHKPTPIEGKNATSKKHKGAVGKTKPTPTVSIIDVDPKKSNTPSEPSGTAEILSDPVSHVTEPKIVIDEVTAAVEVNSMVQNRQAVENEYINALCNEANSEKYKSYPRYEFLPVCEPTSEEQRFATKTNIIGMNVRSVCVYWTNSSFLYFFSLDKPNKNLEASIEELRVFGAPIVSIRTCTTTQLSQTSACKDHCGLPSLFHFLLIGLRNGIVIVRDLQTTQFVRTVKAHADPVLQMTLCPPVDTTKDIHLYALSCSYSTEQENHIGLFRMLKLTPEQTCVSSEMTTESLQAVTILTLDESFNVVAALTTTSDLLVYRICGFDTTACLEPCEVDPCLPLRIRLPSPYQLSCRSNTVGLLPNCLYSRQNSELANQLQLTKRHPEENSTDLIDLWIRGIFYSRTESGTQQQNERLFCVQIHPLSTSHFVREDTIRSDITITDHPMSNDSGTDLLMKYADSLMRQRLAHRTIRKSEFQQIWDELPNYMNSLLHTVPT
ncbi:hypothetical protein PHET_00850 [Paragonimus heterotremus]|uniref:Uncharacterized protein n=1 Tax=Paragonimus heterotremus TaxID=100268 RepID=A0A8J4X3C0_9TREM|nr:hypothetical protein PHET_00850 [Paragonimus heterotremus]